MASTPWSPPPAEPAAPHTAPQAAALNLRPLSLGELLDRVFSVYRANFPLFAGIAAMAALVQLVLASLQVGAQHILRQHVALSTVTMVTLVVGYTLALVIFLAFSVVHAATVYALAEIYMGRPATVGGSLQAVSPRSLRYIGIALWQFFAAAGVYLLFALPGIVLVLRNAGKGNLTSAAIGGGLLAIGALAGIPVGVILYLRNSLAVPAAVLENLPVRAAMRRSKDLAAGAKGRIFVLLLVATGLWFVVGVLQMPMVFVVARATMQQREALWAQAVSLVIGFFGVSVVSPVPSLGLALLYYDQRVRKEAWDLELLLGAQAPAPPAPAAPTYVAAPSESDPENPAPTDAA